MGRVRASRERKRSRTESNRKVRKVFGRALRVLRAAGGDDGGDDGNGDRGGSAAAFLPKRSRRRAEAARRIREESAFGAVRREQPRGPLAERARDEESVTLYK